MKIVQFIYGLLGLAMPWLLPSLFKLILRALRALFGPTVQRIRRYYGWHVWDYISQTEAVLSTREIEYDAKSTIKIPVKGWQPRVVVASSPQGYAWGNNLEPSYTTKIVDVKKTKTRTVYVKHVYLDPRIHEDPSLSKSTKEWAVKYCRDNDGKTRVVESFPWDLFSTNLDSLYMIRIKEQTFKTFCDCLIIHN